MSAGRTLVAALGALAFGFVSSFAHAATQADDGRARDSAQRDTRRPLALTVNPLAFVIQRYGGNVEYSFLPHHAIVGTVYAQSLPVSMVRPFAGNVAIRDAASSPGFGGELGYRLYSGGRGADGLFIGGSVLAMPLAYPRLARDLAVELERVYGVGGAVDIGAQTVTSFGLTIGGGIGVSLLAYDMPNDPSRLPFAMPHVLPRLLLQTGYSF